MLLKYSKGLFENKYETGMACANYWIHISMIAICIACQGFIKL